MHRKILFSLLAMTSAFKAGTSAFESVSFAEHELADFEPELFQTEEELAVYNGKEIFEAESWLNEEIILNEEDTLSFKADEENSSEHPSLKQSSPRVGVDRLCSSSNTVGKVCTIKDKTLRFSTDLHYKSELTIVLDNTKIKCLTIAYSPCSFMISL